MSEKSIHVFNERGESTLALRALARRVEALEAENARLKRLLAHQARRLTSAGALLPAPAKH